MPLADATPEKRQEQYLASHADKTIQTILLLVGEWYGCERVKGHPRAALPLLGHCGRRWHCRLPCRLPLPPAQACPRQHLSARCPSLHSHGGGGDADGGGAGPDARQPSHHPAARALPLVLWPPLRRRGAHCLLRCGALRYVEGREPWRCSQPLRPPLAAAACGVRRTSRRRATDIPAPQESARRLGWTMLARCLQP